MFVSSCLNVNPAGHLTIDGVDTLDIAKEFGTPLYVMSEDTIRKSCQSYVDSIKKFYDGNGRAVYASKALNCKELCRIMADENMGIDVVSGGELYTALSVGFPVERICFHGNNKTPEELEMAIDNNVGVIVIDNLDELKSIEKLAEEKNTTANVMIRVKPGVDAHTHNFVRTGQIDSKFGVALETGEALDAICEIIAQKHVVLKGLHCHIGSQIFDYVPFEEACEKMLMLMDEVRQKTGYVIEQLDMGGGFGIKYLESDDALPYELFIEKLTGKTKSVCEKIGFPLPFLMVEPGRSIVAPAGITLYTVGSIKTIPDVRTYVLIDGGMGDNPRYIMYQSDYTAVVANRAAEKADNVVTIAGRCCESGDLIQEHTKIQQVTNGDILAVLATGAYNYSMASNYNRIPRPAMVMVTNGKPRLIIKRESFEDVVRCDI